MNHLTKILLAIWLTAVTAFGAAFDIKTTQKNSTDTAWGTPIFAPTASSLWGFDSGKIPISITASGALDLLGSTQGSILYRNASGWVPLTPGTSGQLLSTQGAAANPIWVTATGGAGDFNGPASATDNAIVRFDGTGGKTGQNSAVTIADTTGAMTWATGQAATLTGGDNGASLALGAGTSGGATFNLSGASTPVSGFQLPAYQLRNSWQKIYGISTGDSQLRVLTFGDSMAGTGSNGMSIALSFFTTLGNVYNMVGSGVGHGLDATGGADIGSTTAPSDPGDYTRWMTGVLPSTVGTGGTLTYGALGASAGASCDTLKVYYIKEPGAGTFKVQSSTNNGGLWSDEAGYTNVDANNGTMILGIITISKGAVGSYMLRVVGLTGNVYFLPSATGQFRTTLADGVEVFAIQNGGLALANANLSSSAVLTAWLADVGINLALFEMKETVATFAADLTTFQSRFDAGSTAIDWVFCASTPVEVDDSDQLALNRTLRAHTVENGKCYFDGYLCFGSFAIADALGWMSDGIHRTPEGSSELGWQLLRQTGLVNTTLVGVGKVTGTTGQITVTGTQAPIISLPAAVSGITSLTTSGGAITAGTDLIFGGSGVLKQGGDTLLSTSGTTVIHAADSDWAGQQFWTGGVNRLTVTSAGVTTPGVYVAGSGPTTLTDAAGKILSAALNTVTATVGGTGQTTYTIGDTLAASSSTALAKVSTGATGTVLTSNGVGALPTYQAVGAGNSSYATYAAGTVYAMTASDAAIDFGTTDPTITITSAGRYLILGRAYLKYNGATYVANQTATVHLQRTNNTPAAITNATTTATLRIITTLTDTVGIMEIPAVVYTATAGDVLSVYGSLSATPAAGSVDATEASIVAIPF